MGDALTRNQPEHILERTRKLVNDIEPPGPISDKRLLECPRQERLTGLDGVEAWLRFEMTQAFSLPEAGLLKARTASRCWLEQYC
jgi:hypothetical protein